MVSCFCFALIQENSLNNLKICRVCGRDFDSAPRSHKKPWGADCPNRSLIAVDLVYTFRTDTLQIRFEGTRRAPPRVDNADFWTSFETATRPGGAPPALHPHHGEGRFRVSRRTFAPLSSVQRQVDAASERRLKCGRSGRSHKPPALVAVGARKGGRPGSPATKQTLPSIRHECCAPVARDGRAGGA
jgi:hypothetical protein